MALGQRLVVLHGLGNAGSTGGGGGSGTGGAASGSSRRGSGTSAAAAAAAIEFVSAVDAPETITALCWLAGSGQSAGENTVWLLCAARRVLWAGNGCVEQLLQLRLLCRAALAGRSARDSFP